MAYSRFARDVKAAMLVNVKKQIFFRDDFCQNCPAPTRPLRLCQVKLSLGTGYKQRINMTLACHREAK